MKIYKQNNKFLIYLPNELIKALKLDEKDEVEFFNYNDKAFLFMKKADVVNLLIGRSVAPQPVVQTGKDYLGNEELAVLKKLDTLRYPQRTKEKVNEMLDSEEKAVLQQLLKKKIVGLFEKDGNELYSISKSVYDKFLMRKKQGVEGKASQASRQPAPKARLNIHVEGPYANQIAMLEENGFIVLQTEAEAGGVSLALEESIRHGKVLGIRAFNKKFYIVTREFFDEHNPSILKALRSGETKPSGIANSADMSEDAVMAILYLLAENGDVREKRKDSFALA